MNGEVSQLANLVIAARKALKEGSGLEYRSEKYVLDVKFKGSNKKVNSFSSWFNELKENGLEDIKLFLPTKYQNLSTLGFANESKGAIICFLRDKTSFFFPFWQYDNKKNGWSITYKEETKKVFTFIDDNDSINEFKNVLTKIMQLAKIMKYDNFAAIFASSLKALNENYYEDEKVPSFIPSEFKNIYYAIYQADVFGAMGSWNDSPAWTADEMGMTKAYNDYSNALLEQIRLNLIYIVNHSYN